MNYIERLASKIEQELTDKPPEDVLELFGALKAIWCEHCGYRHPDSHTCNCWNDE